MRLTDPTFDYDAAAPWYDRSHARWLRHAGGEAQCAFEGAAAALLRPGMSVLDAACGSGTVARRLLGIARGNIKLALLDASAQMIARCVDIEATHVLGRMENMPFAAHSFDLITCAWGLETLEDPGPALREFIRVARPGGRICLVFCADRPPQSVIGAFMREHIRYSDRGRFLNCETLTAGALEAGALHVQTLHCTGPAAAMILHI